MTSPPGASSTAGAQVLTGVRVSVRVPATSANLGPGFDCLGLALGLYDVVEVEATAGGVEVCVSGEGADAVPRDESHLVVRALRAGLARAGAAQPGLRLSCVNAVPHGRGLGSSAAAVVAGLVAARGLLARPAPLDEAAVLAAATRFEGHPDNAAAALLGGLTVSWTEPGDDPGPVAGSGSEGDPGVARAVRLPLHPQLRVVVCVPEVELATRTARAMLPTQVAHGDAAFNAGRSALLVHALTARPELLPAATQDRLHQQQRASAMPRTAELVAALRAAGGAAVVSGAGPSVLVLGVGGGPASLVRDVLGARPAGWRIVSPEIDTLGAHLTTEGAQAG